MDLGIETTQITTENEEKLQTNSKRKNTNENSEAKKRKLEEEARREDSAHDQQVEEKLEQQQSAARNTANNKITANDKTTVSNKIITGTTVHVHQSPKKRLQLTSPQKEQSKKPKQQFIYGNYNQYYQYRNKNGKDFHDIRLDVFEQHGELFCAKEMLDIGCNSGFITMEIAKRFPIKHIVGIDIDRGLVNQANKTLVKQKKAMPPKSAAGKEQHRNTFPFNVSFVQGNYVLRDDVLLEIEHEQFDVILCLSITKWIQLNFGDAGLKQAFRRMFLQLRSGGKLILEAQPKDNYGRRKKMNDTILANYRAMNFFPAQFTQYLLSDAVGFKSMKLLGVPEHCAAGFKRPIQVFSKE